MHASLICLGQENEAELAAGQRLRAFVAEVRRGAAYENPALVLSSSRGFAFGRQAASQTASVAAAGASSPTSNAGGATVDKSSSSIAGGKSTRKTSVKASRGSAALDTEAASLGSTVKVKASSTKAVKTAVGNSRSSFAHELASLSPGDALSGRVVSVRTSFLFLLFLLFLPLPSFASLHSRLAH